ncbi:FecR family protein [Paraflavitalea speifideaquila]|uniref:FecR family protein n=1 Tax=Paraflavitalea speifideaquila TaxID=3076558 RepID=UPI0028EC7C08|nr:FecR family protein [Paraflavitalea speifideiaquila]
MEQYKKQLEQVWKEGLPAEEKQALLQCFLEEEVEWKVQLEKEYREDVDSGRVYLQRERAEQVLGQLHKQIVAVEDMGREQKKGGVISLGFAFKWVAAAAIITAMVFIGYDQVQQKKKGREAEQATDQLVSQLRLQTNSSKQHQNLVMEDGSSIRLSPGSSIRYYEPFRGGRRDISLLGQAWFTVAKDSLRPFTVYANDIATTALGTQFMVSTLVKDQVEVRLFEGKVVVRTMGKNMTKKEVYLQPGEACVVNQLQEGFLVKRFNEVAPKKRRCYCEQPSVDRYYGTGACS